MDEFGRLVALSDLDLNYAELKDTFSDIAELAIQITGAEVSLVNLIDAYTQWSVSGVGIDLDQMPREDSVCQYTIQGKDALEINDLSKDVRFRDKSYVAEDPHLKYYLGVPLEFEPGTNIGALCVLDPRPKKLSDKEFLMLKGLAKIAVHRFKLLKLSSDQNEKLHENRATIRRVAHDIRSPLSGVIGLCNMVLQDFETFQPNEVKEYLSLIHQGAESTLDLADHALRVQLEDETESRTESFTLEDLANSLETLFKPQALSKEVSLSISGRSEILEVPIPKNRILQIAGNLVSNAIKFTPPKGRVDVYLNVMLDGDKKVLDIQVHDTGKGMSPELIKSLNHDRTESTVGTSGETGYGFGLPLVKRMLGLMEGHLSVSSSPDTGSRFEVRIPCKI